MTAEPAQVGDAPESRDESRHARFFAVATCRPAPIAFDGVKPQGRGLLMTCARGKRGRYAERRSGSDRESASSDQRVAIERAVGTRTSREALGWSESTKDIPQPSRPCLDRHAEAWLNSHGAGSDAKRVNASGAGNSKVAGLQANKGLGASGGVMRVGEALGVGSSSVWQRTLERRHESQTSEEAKRVA